MMGLRLLHIPDLSLEQPKQKRRKLSQAKMGTFADWDKLRLGELESVSEQNEQLAHESAVGAIST